MKELCIKIALCLFVIAAFRPLLANIGFHDFNNGLQCGLLMALAWDLVTERYKFKGERDRD